MQTLYIPPASIKIVYPANRIKNEEHSNDDTVICSGKDKQSKHPKVYISQKSNTGKCPYCGILFRK